MKSHPKISIVTISFNQAEFLERAILSVLEQDYPNIEYILVDPGSTDGSRDIIKKYRDRIAHVILEPDKGPADGLNKGFAKASGEIYGFLNSDDMLLPGAISEAMKCLTRKPNVDVVSGHCLVMDRYDKILRKGYSTNVSRNGYAYGVTTLIQPSTFFRQKAFHDVGGFNSENRSNWDGELFIDMVLGGVNFAKVQALWSVFRLHNQSITSTKKIEEIYNKDTERLFCKIKGRPRNLRDAMWSAVMRIVKHISHPRATLERLRHGPIYGNVGD